MFTLMNHSACVNMKEKNQIHGFWEWISNRLHFKSFFIDKKNVTTTKPLTTQTWFKPCSLVRNYFVNKSGFSAAPYKGFCLMLYTQTRPCLPSRFTLTRRQDILCPFHQWKHQNLKSLVNLIQCNGGSARNTASCVIMFIMFVFLPVCLCFLVGK